MAFDASTFILEIINFLILVWILQRLFYKPVLDIIEKRKLQIDQSLSEAKRVHNEAQELKALYENRQKLWEQEKKSALVDLQQEIESEKLAQLQIMQQELDSERQKAEVTWGRQQRDFQKQAEQQALLNGARFASLLLAKASGPELEERLFMIMMARLDSLPDVCRPCCLEMLDKDKTGLLIKVGSAFFLKPELRTQLQQKLGALIDCEKKYQYYQDPELISGLRIDIGSWVLHANLQYELTGFAEMAYESE